MDQLSGGGEQTSKRVLMTSFNCFPKHNAYYYECVYKLKWKEKVRKKHILLGFLITKIKKIQSFEPWKMVRSNLLRKKRQLFNRLYEFEDFQLNHCHCRCTNSILLTYFSFRMNFIVVNRDFVHLQMDLKTKLDELKSSCVSGRFPDDDKLKEIL